MAGLIPVAALDDRGAASVAQAAVAPPRQPPPAQPPPSPARPTRPADAARLVEWRESIASGNPNAGRLVHGVELPLRGEGFYTYNPATQRQPGGEGRQWGTDLLVREIIALGKWWARTHPDAPRLGIGDLSRPEGGFFGGPGVGHQSHQNGLDVDIRLVRRDGEEAGAHAGNYDPELTQHVVDRLVMRGADLVLIGPSLDLRGPAGVVTRWPNHDDHLHVRFPDPDGPGN
jgi:murein endopeptidase